MFYEFFALDSFLFLVTLLIQAKNLWANLGLAKGKYLIKIIFDIKSEICIFEISNILSFNKFDTLLILGRIWA